MQVHALSSPPHYSAGPFLREAPRLIDLCGTPGFEAALFAAARQAASCEHLTAFAFAGASEPRIVLAVDTSTQPVARQVARKYVRHYWRLDPVQKAEAAGETGGMAVRILAEDIESSPYRQDCYTGVGLHDRVSLLSAHNGEVLRLNFYRSSRSGRFGEAEIDHILSNSQMIMALLAKHDALTPRHGGDVTASFQRRLCALATPLPRREREVCALIAAGMSSEGIALDLGVSLNTVLTYRKRAYARLGISSQNELLRRLLS